MDGDELPAGWVIARLDAVVSDSGFFGDGDWVESKDQDPDGSVRLVQLADIGEMRFLDKSRRFMTEAKANALKCTFLRRGDLLVSRLGDPLGKACPYPAREDRAVTAVDVCIFRPDTDGIEPDYFGYLLNSLPIRQAIDEQASGTTRKRITGKKLKAVPVPIAPAMEQQRIVEKIETLFAELDKGEEALREVQKLLARYRQSVLKAAVTGTLTADWRAANGPPKENGKDLLARILKTRRETWQGRGKYKEPVEPEIEGLPELPEGWVGQASISSRHRNRMHFGIGPFGSNLRVDDYTGHGVPLIFVRHIRAGDFVGHEPKFVSSKKAEELSSHRAFPGDLLVTKMGDPPGDVAIYPDDAPTAIITADCIRFALSDDGLAKSFIVRAIQSRLVQAQIGKISKGVAQQKVTLANFKKVAIPLPPSGEQNEIAELADVEIDRIQRAGEMATVELRRGAALRQSILKDAFSGKLVPQDPSDEPADKLLDRIRAAREEKPKTKRKKAKA